MLGFNEIEEEEMTDFKIAYPESHVYIIKEVKTY